MIHAVCHSHHGDAEKPGPGTSTMTHGHPQDAGGHAGAGDHHNPPPRPDSPRPDKHLQSYFNGFIAALGLAPSLASHDRAHFANERVRSHAHADTHVRDAQSPTLPPPSALLLSTIHEERDYAGTAPPVCGSVKAHVLERRRTSKACGAGGRGCMSKRRGLHRKVPLRALWEVIINDSNQDSTPREEIP